jgi:hypothetical protein
MRLDTSRFPLVFFRQADQAPASGTPEQQLEALLDRGQAFVLLTDHLPGDHAEASHAESHEERKQRALFFKRNKARMRALCKGLVVLTGERPLPAPARLAAQGAGKALGLAVAFAPDECGGIARAGDMLASQER